MIESAALTETGRKRQTNQDCYLVNSSCKAYLLADGMGGAVGGAEAGRLTVSTISEFIELAQGAAEVTWPFGYDLQVPFETNVLRTAVLVANLHVCRAAEEMEQKVGMGSASPTVPVPTNQAERDPSSGSTPAQAVVIEHREDGQRIATLDIPSGKLEYFGPTDAEPKSPASSPDGRTVTYRTGRTLVLHGQGGSAGSSGSRESRPASVNSLCF